LVQGAALAQVELAATLSRLRSEGVGTLYSGSLARDFIDGAAAAGVTVDAQRLRETLPVWSPATGVEHDNHIWAVAAPTPADVRLGTAAFGTIVEGADWTDGDDDSRAHLMAEALNAATLLAGGDGALDEDTLSDALARYDEDRRGLSAPLPRLERTLGSRATRRAGATAFFAVDRTGLSVACAIGLGAPFGTGRMIPNLGVFLAPVETESGDGPGAFALMAANINTGQFHMATSGAGGRAALSAVTATALDHWESRIQIEAVPDRPRSHYAGGANVLFVEPSTSAEVVSDLQRRGYTVQPAPSIGTANAFRCVEGLPRREIRCGAAPDQRGAGLMLFEFGG
jgi:gamma-glutamyltranspeptidase/glutathione hydrolase